MPTRCAWCEIDDLMRAYHDEEWGVAVHDDRKHFEFIVLDAFQAGLSWSIVLHKRDAFRKAFSGFDPAKIARYDRRRIERLIANPGIIRNRQKIEATVHNARAFLEVQQERGSFDALVWEFVDGKPRQNAWKRESSIPATTKQSDALSKELKRRGFKFAGSTICYAYMQAAGLVNYHVVGCFRHNPIRLMGG